MSDKSDRIMKARESLAEAEKRRNQLVLAAQAKVSVAAARIKAAEKPSFFKQAAVDPTKGQAATDITKMVAELDEQIAYWRDRLAQLEGGEG